MAFQPAALAGLFAPEIHRKPISDLFCFMSPIGAPLALQVSPLPPSRRGAKRPLEPNDLRACAVAIGQPRPERTSRPYFPVTSPAAHEVVNPTGRTQKRLPLLSPGRYFLSANTVENGSALGGEAHSRPGTVASHPRHVASAGGSLRCRLSKNKDVDSLRKSYLSPVR